MKTDRVQVDYILTFQAPFHCGTGIRVGLLDRSVVRDGNDYLYVPGSTFKGVLRERCEQLARFFAQGERDVQSPHDTKAALWGFGQKVTMITRIFGSQLHPGQLFFDDARQSDKSKQLFDSQDKDGEGKYKNLQTGIYTQVRLDRPTRTAVQGALYTSEFGTANIEFQGSITGWLECTAINNADLENKARPEDTPTYSLLLLLAGLQMIEQLGGNRSTGKGKCECKILQLMINGNKYLETQWKPWLEQLNALADYQRVVGGTERAILFSGTDSTISPSDTL